MRIGIVIRAWMRLAGLTVALCLKVADSQCCQHQKGKHIGGQERIIRTPDLSFCFEV